jgi:hypothetical protein
MKEGLLTGKVCPVATQDVHINLKNRNHAFKEYGYALRQLRGFYPDASHDGVHRWWLGKR